MTSNPEAEQRIRRYLLGELGDGAREELEQELLTNGELFDELLMLEDELVDEYLAGTMSSADRQRFESHFLITPERQKKLKFGRAFNRVISSEAAVVSPQEPKRSRLSIGWARAFFSSPFRFAAYAMLLVAVALGVWAVFFRQSEVDKSLLALNAAYREQRPVEARISSLPYAPFAPTRGPGTEKVDLNQLRRAELILLDALNRNPTPAVHHALGKVYLAKKNFTSAIKELEEAVMGDPGNPISLADLGAAYLEKGKSDLSGSEAGKGMGELGRSLDHLNKALALDANLLLALFNRALCKESMGLTSQAAADWREYLKKDATSPWAEEARRALERMEQKQAGVSSSAEQVLRDFLEAHRNQDEARAWRIVSQNRETITRRLVPRQLATLFLESSLAGREKEAGDLLRAFEYAANLELKNAADPYFSEIASFYTSLNSPQKTRLTTAQALVNKGFELCLAGRLADALGQFESARQIFESAGDSWEATLTDYWIAYCYYHTDKLQQSLALLSNMANSCEKRRHRWLLAQTLSLTANVQGGLNEQSKSLETNNRSLKISEEISDSYSVQKSLSQIANGYRYMRGFRQALGHLHRSLTLGGAEYLSPRQEWRNYEIAAQTFYAMGSFNASAAYAEEALRLARDDLKDPAILYLTYLHLGLIYGKLHDYAAAMSFAKSGHDLARSLENPNSGSRQVAYSTLQLANLERYSGNCNKAVGTYDQAIAMYDRMMSEDQKYEAYKGRLVCRLTAGNEAEIEADLAVVLNLFEKYRFRILEEQNRNSFFDTEQSVYDLAISYEFGRARDMERAFAYSEDSRARSLLDSINTGARTSTSAAGPIVTFSGSVSRPLDLATIRERMPDQAQIVQYAMLEDKLIIWLVSKTKFEAVAKDIGFGELEARILRFVELVSTNSESPDSDIRRESAELYNILISPIESHLDPQKETCIVTDKALNYLPFAALVSPRGNYLVSERTLLFSPSSNVFLLCSEAAQKKARTPGEALLSIGNPAFDHQEFPDLPDLPAAAREAEAIASLYPNRTTLIGLRATKRSVLDKMASADVFHFAGHYIVDDRSPLLSKLLLARNAEKETDSDGALNSFEVLGAQPIHPHLILLSACRTAVESNFSGEGIVGMSRSLIAAGVPLVVASQWSVDSEATAELMIKLHQYRMVKGQSTAVALRHAQLEMLSSPDLRHRRPYYWAAFLPIGGSSNL